MPKLACVLLGHRAIEAATATSQCEVPRSCKRCNRSLPLLERHMWGEARYVESNQCERVSTCSRCKNTRPEPISHHWSGWIYRAGEQHRSCNRCGENDVIVEPTPESDSDGVSYCSRCGEPEPCNGNIDSHGNR